MSRAVAAAVLASAVLGSAARTSKPAVKLYPNYNQALHVINPGGVSTGGTVSRVAAGAALSRFSPSRPPDSGPAARLPGCPASRLPGFPAARLPGCPAARLQRRWRGCELR